MFKFNHCKLMTLVGKESADFSAIVYLLFCMFCSHHCPLPVDALDGQCCLPVALPWTSMQLLIL